MAVLLGSNGKPLVEAGHRRVANKLDVANTPMKKDTPQTYRYRDPEKRRAYMRDYMKKRRES